MQKFKYWFIFQILQFNWKKKRHFREYLQIQHRFVDDTRNKHIQENLKSLYIGHKADMFLYNLI